MRLQGFKKVVLKDTKGALTSTNNYKWVNNRTNTTILPSGTKIQTFYDEFSGGMSKTVTKTDGTLFRSFLYPDKSYKLYKRNADGTMSLFKQKTPQEVIAEKAKAAAEALRQKREKFIENFKNKFERTIIRDENGRVTTKMLHNKKTGKLVHWFRNSNGNKSVGDIVYYPAGLGKEVYVQTPDKYIIKSITNGVGRKTVTKTVIPENDLSKMTSTEYSRPLPLKENVVQDSLNKMVEVFEELAEKIK